MKCSVLGLAFATGVFLGLGEAVPGAQPVSTDDPGVAVVGGVAEQGNPVTDVDSPAVEGSVRSEEGGNAFVRLCRRLGKSSRVYAVNGLGQPVASSNGRLESLALTFCRWGGAYEPDAADTSVKEPAKPPRERPPVAQDRRTAPSPAVPDDKDRGMTASVGKGPIETTGEVPVQNRPHPQADNAPSPKPATHQDELVSNLLSMVGPDNESIDNLSPNTHALDFSDHRGGDPYGGMGGDYLSGLGGGGTTGFSGNYSPAGPDNSAHPGQRSRGSQSGWVTAINSALKFLRDTFDPLAAIAVLAVLGGAYSWYRRRSG